MYYRLKDPTCSTTEWFDLNFKSLSTDLVRAAMEAGSNNFCFRITEDSPHGTEELFFDPMWGTCWVSTERDLDETGITNALRANIDVFRVPDLGDMRENEIVLAMEGAGYSFFDEHFRPFRLLCAIDHELECAARFGDKLGEPGLLALRKLIDTVNKEYNYKGEVLEHYREHVDKLIPGLLEKAA